MGSSERTRARSAATSARADESDVEEQHQIGPPRMIST
jgi:hypothetical protein